MLIEKAFAIEADADVIWDALWNDLSGGDQSAYTVVEAHRPHDLVIAVQPGGVPSRLSYRIETRDGHCEVAAVLEPSGLRYHLARVLTFNHVKRNFEMVLVEGLANLKQAVEQPQEPDAG